MNQKPEKDDIQTSVLLESPSKFDKNWKSKKLQVINLILPSKASSFTMSSSNEQLEKVEKSVINKYEESLEDKVINFMQNASMTKYSFMSFGKKNFTPFDGLNIK